MSAPIQSELWNRKQNDVREFIVDVRRATGKFPSELVLDGAVGSGKTSIGLASFVSTAYKRRDRGETYIMSGYTLGALKRNCLDPLTEDFGIITDLDDENRFRLYGNSVFCFGTDKADSFKPIRGIQTAHGYYGNELTLSHRKAIEEIYNRLRGQDAFKIEEMNPANPEHWFYQMKIKEAIEKGNSPRLGRFNFSIYDNAEENGGFLPKEYIEQQEALYSGIWHRQFLRGEWCSLEGQIYHLDELQYYDDAVLENPEWWRGVILNGYLDPAAGSKKKTGCYTSIISGALKGTAGEIYLTDAFVRKAGVSATIAGAGERLGRDNYSLFAYEDNFSQEEYVGTPLKEAFPYQPIQGMSSREDKLSRLIGMHGIVTTKVKFPERWRTERGSDGWLLLQQLCNITRERDERAEQDEMYLDGPDALEGLIRSFRKNSAKTVAIKGGKPVKGEW